MNKLIYIFIISFVIIILAIGIGSVYISPIQTINILSYKIFGYSFLKSINEAHLSILWEIRLPRVLLAFISGSGLALSGSIIQSVLQNSLASSYTLGVSSGVALGASLSLVLSINIFGIFTIQIFGFIAGLITIFTALAIAIKLDKNLNNNSIILVGMVFSLFVNSILTIIINLVKEKAQNLIFWQMGSFAMKNWDYVISLLPTVLIIFILTFMYSKELDILCFGEEYAKTSGISVKKLKLVLIIFSALLTGAIVSFSGIIGFVDLFIPHISRKLMGSKHIYILPATFILGGSFMVICDLIARTFLAPIELPVGAITSLIGAPFFIYLYFNKRKIK